MYTVTMAARIRSDSLASEDSNAWAVPWKLGSMLAGIPSSGVTSLMSGPPCRATPRSQIEGKRHHRKLTLMVDRDGRGKSAAGQTAPSGAGASAAAPVRAVFVPARAIVVARLADADPIGTYMSFSAPRPADTAAPLRESRETDSSACRSSRPAAGRRNRRAHRQRSEA